MSASGKWNPTLARSDGAALIWSVGSLDDAPLAGRLAAEAFDPHFREAWTDGQMAGLLATPSAWLELGKSGSALIAFALCRQAHDEVELLLCATSPAWRRRGVGRELVFQVAERARLRGASRLFLEVRSSNDAAIGLYLASGFSAVGRRRDYYRTLDDRRIDAITLALPL